MNLKIKYYAMHSKLYLLGWHCVYNESFSLRQKVVFGIISPFLW